MFKLAESPTGHFVLLPFPNTFLEHPHPFGAGAMLVLQNFANNSDRLHSEHRRGILIAAAQATASFGPGNGALECYGTTDRTGSETYNKALSTRRANTAMELLRSAMGLSSTNLTFANGLGERFADEYHSQSENSKNEAFRGVICYLWESVSVAMDPFLRVEVAFASPPMEIGGRRRIFLAALHMGRHRAQPPSIFR